MGPASLGAGAAQALAAERLAFDHGPDLVAIHVEIADARMLLDIVAHGVDAALQAKRQAVTGGVDLFDDRFEAFRGKPHEMENWPEILAIQLA